MRKLFFYAIPVTAALLIAGCERQAPPAQSSVQRDKPQPAAQKSSRTSFSELAVPPKPSVTPALLEHGKTVYSQNCVACHGVKGDGKGDAAAFLLPRPRNFVDAKFRLRSTPPNQLPTDEDLFRAVSLGMPGTPMPPWKHILTEEERWAVVEYVKSFSPRFADTNEERRPVTLGSPPPRNDQNIAEGKALFTRLACVTCHGESGHGDGTSAATLVDDSQTKIKPRDFSRPAVFKSGYSTKDIVRTILTGFNGTPMAGFHGTIREEDAWKVAYFVETFARPESSAPQIRASQNFLAREQLGAPDVRIKVTERAWKYDPSVIHVKKNQVVEITFEPTDNGLGVGHGFAISGYDEAVFLNGAMVGAPKSVKFRADHAGKFTFYCATQCSTEKLHPLMNGTLVVEDDRQAAANE